MREKPKHQSWKSGLLLAVAALSILASAGLLLLYDRTPDRWLVGVLGIVSGVSSFWHWDALRNAELRARYFEAELDKKIK